MLREIRRKCLPGGLDVLGQRVRVAGQRDVRCARLPLRSRVAHEDGGDLRRDTGGVQPGSRRVSRFLESDRRQSSRLPYLAGAHTERGRIEES
jgi:hypothetical protein